MTRRERKPRDPASFMSQVEDAKLQCAKQALAMPFMFNEGCELDLARKALVAAVARATKAEAAWKRLIAPANEWAEDPLNPTKTKKVKA